MLTHTHAESTHIQDDWTQPGFSVESPNSVYKVWEYPGGVELWLSIESVTIEEVDGRSRGSEGYNQHNDHHTMSHTD